MSGENEAEGFYIDGGKIYHEGHELSKDEALQALRHMSVMADALMIIMQWSYDSFPDTGRFHDGNKESPVSYTEFHGISGERDFMRELAKKALEVTPKHRR